MGPHFGSVFGSGDLSRTKKQVLHLTLWVPQQTYPSSEPLGYPQGGGLRGFSKVFLGPPGVLAKYAFWVPLGYPFGGAYVSIVFPSECILRKPGVLPPLRPPPPTQQVGGTPHPPPPTPPVADPELKDCPVAYQSSRPPNHLYI